MAAGARAAKLPNDKAAVRAEAARSDAFLGGREVLLINSVYLQSERGAAIRLVDGLPKNSPNTVPFPYPAGAP